MQPADFMTETLKRAPWGPQAAEILYAAIQAVDPYKVVERQLYLVGDQLHLGRQTYNLRKNKRIFLVGAGKAGLPMTQAVVDKLGIWITDGLVIVKEGYGGPANVGPVQIVEAGHPIPDQRGLAATQSMLALLANAQQDDLVLVVLSGGGSALLTSPVPGVSLQELQLLTNLLLASGATIEEINRIRKHLDTVKGGGLGRAAAPAAVAAMILSDVVGDPLDLIASGPTVSPSGRWQPGLELIARYGLEAKLPPAVLKALHAPPQPPLFSETLLNNILVGNNEVAARGAMDKAQQLGYNTQLLTTTMQGEARLVGSQMSAQLRAFAEAGKPRPAVWVAGGETTVTLGGEGMGGRNQELALAAVEGLAGLERAALISLATDGGDGPTNAAGAVVTGQTLARASALGLDPDSYLKTHDSFLFFSRLGDCLLPGPTRTNVNDLLFLFLF